MSLIERSISSRSAHDRSCALREEKNLSLSKKILRYVHSPFGRMNFAQNDISDVIRVSLDQNRHASMAEASLSFPQHFLALSMLWCPISCNIHGIHPEREPFSAWNKLILRYRRYSGSWAYLLQRITGIGLVTYLFIHIWALTSLTKAALRSRRRWSRSLRRHLR